MERGAGVNYSYLLAADFKFKLEIRSGQDLYTIKFKLEIRSGLGNIFNIGRQSEKTQYLIMTKMFRASQVCCLTVSVR